MKAPSLFVTLFAALASSSLGSTLEEDFQNPPTISRPYVWWHWMGSNISKHGITQDLEAMKAAGIGGATIFNLTSAVQEYDAPTFNCPTPELKYRSPGWWEMVAFAASEAERLGLEVGMHNCVGYSATGGPWVTPEKSMQKVVCTMTPVTGPTEFNGVLPTPAAGKLGYYAEIAVLAIPDGDVVDPKSIVYVSGKMDASGKLAWSVPAGGWKIYRFGHCSTGAGPHPIPEDVKALEVDKMSAEFSRFHFQQVIEPLREHLGANFGKSFHHLTMDSYEAGPQNWSAHFREEFKDRRGYDPVLWLAAQSAQISGKKLDDRVLGDAAQTARFAWDWKDAIAQAFQEHNFEQGAKLANDAGLDLQFEPYSGPFDSIAGATAATIPMVEFWTGSKGAGGAVVLAGHAAGHRVIGAESFTSVPGRSKWSEDPAFLKVSGDGAYANGVNRLVLHHWVHQPFDDRYKPGMGMGWWGTHFGRNQTWFEPGKAFFAYLGRCQALLQRGEPVADFCTLDFGTGTADAIPRATLLKGVRVDNGRIVLPSGRSHPFLALPNSTAMLPEVARKLKELVMAGGVVVGPKPDHSPSLANYPACDAEVKAIADELWGKADDQGTVGNKCGNGRVIWGSDYAKVLVDMKIGPEFTLARGSTGEVRINHRRDGNADIYFVANLGEKPADFAGSFRVAGKTPELWQAENASRTVAGVWRETNGRTEVDLHLRSHQTLFVIFQKPALADHAVAITAAGGAGSELECSATDEAQLTLRSSQGASGEVTFASGKRLPFSCNPPKPVEVSGPWMVSFGPGLGAPEKIEFPALDSWSQNPDPAIKYFSGTAVYRKQLAISADQLSDGKRVILDLGRVANLADITVNGHKMGVAWYPPFQRDITDAVQPGANQIEIAVTNTWANRLIGDEQEPVDQEWGKERNFQKGYVGRGLVAYPDWFVRGEPRPSKDRKCFVNWNYFMPTDPLLEAGLLGPVTLRFQAQVILLAK